jgi:hypothetical protein
MTFEDMKTVMPLWMNLSIEIFKDKDANAVSARAGGRRLRALPPRILPGRRALRGLGCA